MNSFFEIENADEDNNILLSLGMTELGNFNGILAAILDSGKGFWLNWLDNSTNGFPGIE